MPTPSGYLTQNEVVGFIRSKTGYGRLVILTKISELVAQGVIRWVPNPGHKASRLLSLPDVEKVIAALTLPPVE